MAVETASGKRKRWGWIVALAALALAIAAAGLWLRPPLADVARIQARPLVRSLQFTARVATPSRVEVGATVTGRVRQVLVAEGAAVRAGQPLVLLEDDEARAALAQAQAAQAQSQATLRNARAERARKESLVAQGFVSASQADDARRAVDVAQAQQVAAEAAVEVARVRLAQARLLAPTDARVLARQVEPGQIVQPGKALLSLALRGRTQLVAQVDERFLAQLREGQPAAVVADAFPGQPFAARVATLAPGVDAQRGAIEVKLDLAGPAPAFLREDLTVSVEVETGRRDAALALPATALREGGTAWVAREGRVQAVPVTLGLRTLDAAEVTAGLSAGDLVLVGDGPRPGQRLRLRVVDWTARAPAAAAPTRDDAARELSGSFSR